MSADLTAPADARLTPDELEGVESFAKYVSANLSQRFQARVCRELVATRAENGRLEVLLAAQIGEMHFRDGHYRPIANTFMTGDTRKLSPRQRTIFGLRRDPEMERILAESLGEHPREVTPT